MVAKVLLLCALIWTSIGWAIAGLVTVRNIQYFRTVGLVRYTAGAVLVALVWPSVLTALLTPKPPSRGRKPGRTTR